MSEQDLKSITKQDSILHPGRYENYKNYSEIVKRDLENTRLTNEQWNLLAKAWNFRLEKITVSLRFQIRLKEQGAALLKLIEPKYNHQN